MSFFSGVSRSGVSGAVADAADLALTSPVARPPPPPLPPLEYPAAAVARARRAGRWLCRAR